MEFTKEQLSELICKHTEKENGSTLFQAIRLFVSRLYIIFTLT